MRKLFAAALIALPGLAVAQEAPPTPKIPLGPAPEASAISTEMGSAGIAPTLARLTALPSPTPEERFAIGGLEFLAGLERLAKLRAHVALPPDLHWVAPIFAPIAPAELTRPLAPGEIKAVTEAFVAAMERASAALAALPEGAEFGFALDARDLWFDLDDDGQRSPFEDAAYFVQMLIIGTALPQDETSPPPIVRFDTADAAWLSAYAHVLAGMGELLSAYDLEAAMTKAAESQLKLKKMTRTVGRPPLDSFETWIDPIAIFFDTISQQPKPEHTRAAAAHWRAMIADNKRFWHLVAQETDNQAEWIPNDQQNSILGLEFPPGLGATWQKVLADGEALLNGTRALPFWRSSSVGIDAAAWLENPAPLDLPGLAQGWALAPYFSAAPVIDAQSWRQLESLVGYGNGTFMAITLN